jgi:hypothetical protein
MVGHNRLLVAQEDRHSVSTMERTYAAYAAYAAWIKGAKTDEVERIKAAMAGRPRKHGDGCNTHRNPSRSAKCLFERQ